MHAPSRPLMRSLLLQFQTPTAPRRAVGFFGSGCRAGCPAELDHPVYFALAKFYFSQPFRPSTGNNPSSLSNYCQGPFLVQCTRLNCRAVFLALFRLLRWASARFPHGESEGSVTSKAVTPWRQSALAAVGLRL